MDVWECLKTRRSIRAFSQRDVENEKILKILEAATWAPTAGNRQIWIFVVIRNKERIKVISSFSPGLIGVPKVVIVACTKSDQRGEEEPDFYDELALLDIAMACENLMLAAWSLGVGSCAIRSFNKKAVAKLINLPKNVCPRLLVSIGYPEIIPQMPQRLPLEKIVYWETFGSAFHDDDNR